MAAIYTASQPEYVEFVVVPKPFPFYAKDAYMKTVEEIKRFTTKKWSKKDVTYALFSIANCVYVLLAMMSVIVGCWLYKTRDSFAELTPVGYAPLSSAGFCLITGIVVFVIVVVGTYATHVRSRALLICYSIFIGFLILTEVVVGGLGFFSKRIRNDMRNYINLTSITTRNGESMNVTLSWNHLQNTLRCCGIDGPDDWHHNQRWPNSKFYPDSCCDPAFFADNQNNIKNCGKIGDVSFIYKNGCYQSFSDWLYLNQYVVSIVCLLMISAGTIVLVTTYFVFKRFGRVKTDADSIIRRGRSVSETAAEYAPSSSYWRTMVEREKKYQRKGKHGDRSANNTLIDHSVENSSDEEMAAEERVNSLKMTKTLA